MDVLSTLPSPGDCKDPDDTLKVLGRVADAFDNPTLHKTDKQLLFVVNVVKSRYLLPSLSSKDSVFQDTSYGSNDSSFDTSYDEDVEVVELRDVGIWEHTTSYPYASRPRGFSERVFREDNGVYDITKMLLTSSPLDRLDHLARMELKKTGWVERADKWTVVDMGLQRTALSKTPPKTPTKHTVSESRERSSSPLRSGKTMSPRSEKQASCSSLQPQTDGGQSSSKREHNHVLERNRIKSSAPASIRSPVLSQESGSYMVDFSPDSPRFLHASPITPARASLFSRALVQPRTQQQTGGRLGQVVRNFVKRMLPPPSDGSGPPCSPSNSQPRTRSIKGSPSARTCQAEMTLRSDVSGESAWTFASAGMWLEAGQGCLEYQTSGRWRGLWH